MRAARHGDTALIERLLLTGGCGLDGEGEWVVLVPVSFLLEERDNDGDTALAYAIMWGNDECARMLVRAGANVNTRSDNSWTPLMNAVWYNRVEIVRFLLENGADPAATNESDGTALVLAAQEGYSEVLQELLLCGVGRMDDALCSAVQGGHVACVDVLLAAGVDPTTGLLKAAECGTIEILEMLLRAGADPDVEDEDGWGPLMWFATRVDGEGVDVMTALLEAKSQWTRLQDGSWGLVVQRWGPAAMGPPPVSLTWHLTAAAQSIQRAWRAATSRPSP
jgi:ankyrin repeat protein